MILDKLKNIIKEELDGDINIRGYNIKIKLDKEYPFILKVRQLALPDDYVVRDLLPEDKKKALSEKENASINFGKAVDEFVRNIWNSMTNFYILNKIEIDLESLSENIISKYSLDTDKSNFIKLGRTIISVINIFLTLGYKIDLYSKRISGRSSRIPLQIYGIEPDIIIEGKNKIIGDVKYGFYTELFKNVITAYALIYEDLMKEDVDYGMLIHIKKDNMMPEIEIFKINDKYRSDTIELVKEKYASVFEKWKQYS